MGVGRWGGWGKTEVGGKWQEGWRVDEKLGGGGEGMKMGPENFASTRSTPILEGSIGRRQSP